MFTSHGLSRRSFLRGAAVGGAILAVAPMTLLTGCDIQSELEGLLSEAVTQWQAFDTATGKTLSASIVNDFNTAISVVKGWVPGNPAQDVVQALQVVSGTILPLISVLSPVDQAIGQAVLGTIVNLIEYFDPNAAPTAAGGVPAAHAAIIASARAATAAGSLKGQKVTVEGIRRIRSNFRASIKAAVGSDGLKLMHKK